jgi:hypothetical protein
LWNTQAQGWARSQNWGKKWLDTIRYDLISIWYDTIWKWQFSERCHLNFHTEIIKIFVFQMWMVIIWDIILWPFYIHFWVQNYQFDIISSTKIVQIENWNMQWFNFEISGKDTILYWIVSFLYHYSWLEQ